MKIKDCAKTANSDRVTCCRRSLQQVFLLSRDGSGGISTEGIVIEVSSLCAHSLVHPGEQFIFGNDHPLADGDGGKVLGVHQCVCVGAGDTEHGGYVIGVQCQRELIVRSVGSCHRVSPF